MMGTWEGGTHDQKSLEPPADLPSDAGGEDENSKGRCPVPSDKVRQRPLIGPSWSPVV